MDRLPGGVKAAFMAGGDNDIDAGFLQRCGAFDGGDDMHPDKACVFNLVFQTDRIACGGENDFKMLFDVGVFFADA
jgi:hypothetical protein